MAGSYHKSALEFPKLEFSARVYVPSPYKLITITITSWPLDTFQSHREGVWASLSASCNFCEHKFQHQAPQITAPSPFKVQPVVEGQSLVGESGSLSSQSRSWNKSLNDTVVRQAEADPFTWDTHVQWDAFCLHDPKIDLHKLPILIRKKYLPKWAQLNSKSYLFLLFVPMLIWLVSAKQ